MSYKPGDLVTISSRPPWGTAVWNDDLSDGVDFISLKEVAIVIQKPEAEYGWVRIITPRGIIGTVHSTNINKT